MHIINAKKRDIRTWKNHLFSGLSGNDKLFTMHLWEILLDNTQITLKMLRTSRYNLKISAHAIIEENFYCKKTPLAPSGTKVIAHKESNRRRTWVQHGVQF